jgi:hypothetical protein
LQSGSPLDYFYTSIAKAHLCMAYHFKFNVGLAAKKETPILLSCTQGFLYGMVAYAL